MNDSSIIMLAGSVALIAIIMYLVYQIICLRRVVPTNMVHIVQTRRASTPYGRGKSVGNVYYEFPAWIPFYGVTVTKFQESIFQINLKSYDSYDSSRLPFVIDVSAFFRVADAEMVALRVSSFDELQSQLEAILQGAVRRVLATTKLEEIMEERAALGAKFTSEVEAQIKEWGVSSVKTIEFMDLRDAPQSNVIANIMAKEKSRIDRESRVVVASNLQQAESKEIEARRTVEIQQQDAQQQIGVRTAEKTREVGIADELSRQSILEQSKLTTERDMEVKKVTLIKQSEMDKEAAVILAEQEKQQIQIKAEADLKKSQLSAQGILADGEARATAEKLMLSAPVEAQVSLAKEIGSNEAYQQYLITIKKVEVDGQVRIANAAALEKADLKLLVNSGDVQSGINKLTDLFTSKGGSALNGMLETLSMTPNGQDLVEKIVGLKNSSVIDAIKNNSTLD